MTAKLLGLTAPRVNDKKGSIVANKDVLDLLFALLVDILLVEGNDGLGYALAYGINLGGVASNLDTDVHVDPNKVVSSDEQDRLVGLEPKDLRLHKLDRVAIDLDKAMPSLAIDGLAQVVRVFAFCDS